MKNHGNPLVKHHFPHWIATGWSGTSNVAMWPQRGHLDPLGFLFLHRNCSKNTTVTFNSQHGESLRHGRPKNKKRLIFLYIPVLGILARCYLYQRELPSYGSWHGQNFYVMSTISSCQHHHVDHLGILGTCNTYRKRVRFTGEDARARNSAFFRVKWLLRSPKSGVKVADKKCTGLWREFALQTVKNLRRWNTFGRWGWQKCRGM